MNAGAIAAYRYALIAATAAMFALHLVSTPLLRRGVRAVTLLRWEAAYYVLLLLALIVPEFRRVAIPAVVLAALHLGGWVFVEKRPSDAIASAGVLRAVQVFDAAEAVVLAWIAVALL